MPRLTLITFLIFPIIVWAKTPCQTADQYVVRALYLDSAAHAAQQKKYFRRAIALCPTHPEAHNNLAVVLEQEQNYSDALYHYQQALKHRPNYVKAWLGLGDVYYQQGQLPLSLEAYLQICTQHQRARQRVAALLEKHRYRTVDGNQVLSSESLNLLFDQSRLETLYQQANQCRTVDRDIAPNPEATRAIREPVAVFRNIQFKVGRFYLSLVSEQQLTEIATTLIQMNARHIQIRGHSDSQAWKGQLATRSRQLNLKLSQERANSVKSALMSKGVLDRMKTVGYGENSPLVNGHFETAWAQNRRVEIEVKN
ncbi:MAG TPA: tetratricopeptide repeat protein [Thioploca sp.]|nr:tetratricopeptide repeat protein [Thioploca sp.]